MKITLHRDTIGIDEQGVWRELGPAGWVKIERPAWAVDEPKHSRPRAETATPMTDPYKRNITTVPLVGLFRVIELTVPDYEAEVLLRNGWLLSDSERP